MSSDRRRSILGKTLTEMGTAVVAIGSFIMSGLITTALIINTWPLNGPQLGLILLGSLLIPTGITLGFYVISNHCRHMYSYCCFHGVDDSSEELYVQMPANQGLQESSVQGPRTVPSHENYVSDDYLLQFKVISDSTSADGLIPFRRGSETAVPSTSTSTGDEAV